MNDKQPHHLFEKFEVKKDLYQYYFIEKGTEPNSIFVLLDTQRHKALVLDTALPDAATSVKNDLDSLGIQAEMVIISHFHPDHSGGAIAFKNLPMYASRHYEYNFENCKRWRPDLIFTRPTHLLKDKDTLIFGPFRLEFTEAPGHSQCGFIIRIDDDVLHAGDLLMFDTNSRPTLPYISMGGGFPEHIRCLEQLKSMNFKTLIVPHSHILTDKTKIIDTIDDYLHYLKRTFHSKGTLPLSVCLKKSPQHYAHTDFHDNNLLHLMM